MNYDADLKHLRTTLEKFEKIHSDAVVNGDHMDEILYKENIENVKHQIHIHEQAAKVDEYEVKAKAFDEIFKLYIGYEDGWISFPRGSKSFNKEVISVCKYYESGENDGL